MAREPCPRCKNAFSIEQAVPCHCLHESPRSSPPPIPREETEEFEALPLRHHPQEMPYFEARTAFHLEANRDYRIYFDGERILFLYMQKGQHTDILKTTSVHSSMVGGVAGAAIGWHRMQAEQAMERHRELLSTLHHASLATLQEIVNLCPHSFQSDVGDLTDVRFASPSFWHSFLFGNFDYAGLLHLHHPERGRLTLQIDTFLHLRTAVQKFRELLGDRLTVRLPGFRKYADRSRPVSS